METKTHPRAAGFTYLWMLFAVAFISVAMLLTAELWSTTVKRERERELIFVGRQFRDAIGRYYEATPGAAKQYPASLEDLLKDPRAPDVRRHLRRIVQDPMSRSKDWGILRIGGRIVGIHSLSEETPLKNAGFSLSEANFQGREKYSEWIFTYPPDLMVNLESKPKAAESGFGGFGATSSVQLQKIPDSSKEVKDDVFKR